MQQRIAEAVAAAVAAPNDLTEEASAFKSLLFFFKIVICSSHACCPLLTCTTWYILMAGTLLPSAPLHLVYLRLQLRLQVDKLRERIAGLEEELASEKTSSAKVLDDASCQVEGLRALNLTVRKCTCRLSRRKRNCVIIYLSAQQQHALFTRLHIPYVTTPAHQLIRMLVLLQLLYGFRSAELLTP